MQLKATLTTKKSWTRTVKYSSVCFWRCWCRDYGCSLNRYENEELKEEDVANDDSVDSDATERNSEIAGISHNLCMCHHDAASKYLNTFAARNTPRKRSRYCGIKLTFNSFKCIIKNWFRSKDRKVL